MGTSIRTQAAIQTGAFPRVWGAKESPKGVKWPLLLSHTVLPPPHALLAEPTPAVHRERLLLQASFCTAGPAPQGSLLTEYSSYPSFKTFIQQYRILSIVISNCPSRYIPCHPQTSAETGASWLTIVRQRLGRGTAWRVEVREERLTHTRLAQPSRFRAFWVRRRSTGNQRQKNLLRWDRRAVFIRR